MKHHTETFFKPLDSDDGRTIFETLLVIIFVSLILVIALERFVTNVGATREAALRIELSNMRTAIGYFMLAERRLPGSLKELVGEDALSMGQLVQERKEYNLVIASKYVMAMTKDQEGYPTDPFENRYSYDPATGRIWSTTKGYESW